MKDYVLPIGILIFFFFLASVGWCKITFDNTSSAAFSTSGSVTWAHVMKSSGVCVNSCLVVTCGNDASTFTNMTYAGIALTKRVDFLGTSTLDIWTLNNSTASGSNNIVVTGGAVNTFCSAASFCGVDPNTPMDASGTAQTTETNPSVSVTVVSSGAWLIDGIFNSASTIVDPPRANRNVIFTQFAAGGPASFASQTNGPFAAVSQTSSWTEPTSIPWTKAVMAIRASTGTPIVTTQQPSAISQTTATGNGVLLSSGGFTVSASGICISTGTNPTTGNTCFNASGPGAFTASMTGLTPLTGYHARAYATNSVGTDYGDDVPFGTIGYPGGFVTGNVGSTTVTGNGGTTTVQ